MKPRGYALFDLDQTLVPWDMQLLFANWIFKHYPTRRILLVPFLSALPLGKFLGARRLKQLFLGILYNLTAEEMEELTSNFVNHYFPTLFYSETLEKLQAHQKQGDLVILTSASPSFYVRKIGEKLGVDHSFGTEVFRNTAPFPRIPVNNKGEHKIDALKEWFKAHGHHPLSFPLPRSTAYTDSTADLPLLNACEAAVLIHPSRRLIHATENMEKPYQVLTPPRPFKTKGGKILSALKLLCGVYPV